MAAVMRRLEEYGLPELVVAAVVGDADVSHATAARGGFLGWFAHARRPAHLHLARPQLVTERAGFRLVLEQGSRHLNDHARTSFLRGITTRSKKRLQPKIWSMTSAPLTRTGRSSLR